MNIVVAQSAGFCWGVRQAMDAVLEASARWGAQGPVQTLGPLIHNPQALEQLARRGVTEADTVASLKGGTVVVRAHGIPVHELRDLKERHRRKSLRLVNGTCPEVAQVQARIKRYGSKGYFTVLLGTHGHAEAVAHESYASSGCAVVSNLQEATALTFGAGQKVLVIAQTTFLVPDFDEIAAHIRSQVRDCVVLNTICKDTWKRQREAEDLCRRSDFLVVIGGKSSNNTKHLVDLAIAAGRPFQWVESSADLDMAPLCDIDNVGVLAGASTPTWTVDEVVEALEQTGRPSRWLPAARFVRTLQFPLALALGLLTWLLHRLLAWPTGWVGPALSVAFHLAHRAVLPYLDPQGLGGRGQIQELFLRQNRWVLLGLGGASGLAALVCATLLGTRVMFGILLTGAIVVLYQHRPRFLGVQRLPGAKDLGQAFVPALLAVGLPSLQYLYGEVDKVLSAFLVVFFSGLALHGLRHLRAFREDRVLGQEILTVVLGSRATRWTAVGLLAASGAILAWLIGQRPA